MNGTKNTLKSLGLGPKDKACKSIIPRDIQIGEHPVTVPVNTVSNNVNSASPAGTIVNTPNLTIIIISGADYAKLSTIQERLKKCATVSEAKMKFDTNTSSINISHSGSVEELVTLILSACKDIFSNKNVIGVDPDERRISLRL